MRLWAKRTDYIHPEKPLQPEEDAKACIKDLGFVINELADVFKHFEIRKGVLVPKGFETHEESATNERPDES